MTITCSVESITPQKAKILLAGNVVNRKLRKNHVSGLAAAMARGEWRVTHQGIALADDNSVIDGQHRLHAVVQSGRTVSMFVVRGADPQTFDSVDIGERRSIADTLKISNNVAAVLSLAARIVDGNLKATPRRMADWHASLGSEADALFAAVPQNRKHLSTAGLRLAAICSILAGEDRDYVYGIYNALCDGEFDSLPPVGLAFLRLILRGGSFTNGSQFQTESLARGRIVFSKRSAGVQRVMVRDSASGVEWARPLLQAKLAETVS